MNHDTMLKLLGTIDQLDATLDVLNLSGDSLLCQQQDDLPYGAVYNARKVCIRTLLDSVPSTSVGFFNAEARFTSLLEDRSAIGALRETFADCDETYNSLRGQLSAAVAEHDHEDTIADLRADVAAMREIYISLYALVTIANNA